ncbi:ABC transporter permease [Tepidimonas charontis]|uniref:Branched-chain amino acid transport system / permease component n=1 Tax=Tepidimonas charontis TaxID=2267262 RepID=A0A554X7Q2_9BURK|nr:ABC transporter permease [Tepidimonas charontis]TSE31862.1 Branched-chain amino acid transport system / permease component [Tepidimonas charontis]
MWRLERRPAPSRLWSVGSPLLAALVTVVLGIGLFALLGKDPLAALRVFFWEPMRDARAWSELMLKATPLVLIALGLALGFRANVWNIGAEGQFIIGAVCAGGVALGLKGAAVPVWPLVLLAGIAGGWAWAAVTAALRDRFHANEILVSLMLVYVAVQVLNYVVYGPWKDPMGFNFPQTERFDASALVPRLFAGLRVNLGLVLAAGAVVAAWLFMTRTLAGFAQQVGGLAPAAARYAGFSERASLWLTMSVSGALAGLAGALEVAGPVGQLTPHVPVGYGFAAIIVAFVGRLHPVGIVGAAWLMSLLVIGGELAQSRLGLPKSITGVFQGLLLFALLACDALIHFRLRWRRA